METEIGSGTGCTAGLHEWSRGGGFSLVNLNPTQVMEAPAVRAEGEVDDQEATELVEDEEQEPVLEETTPDVDTPEPEATTEAGTETIENESEETTTEATGSENVDPSISDGENSDEKKAADEDNVDPESGSITLEEPENVEQEPAVTQDTKDIDNKIDEDNDADIKDDEDAVIDEGLGSVTELDVEDGGVDLLEEGYKGTITAGAMTASSNSSIYVGDEVTFTIPLTVSGENDGSADDLINAKFAATVTGVGFESKTITEGDITVSEGSASASFATRATEIGENKGVSVSGFKVTVADKEPSGDITVNEKKDLTISEGGISGQTLDVDVKAQETTMSNENLSSEGIAVGDTNVVATASVQPDSSKGTISYVEFVWSWKESADGNEIDNKLYSYATETESSGEYGGKYIATKKLFGKAAKDASKLSVTATAYYKGTGSSLDVTDAVEAVAGRKNAAANEHPINSAAVASGTKTIKINSTLETGTFTTQPTVIWKDNTDGDEFVATIPQNTTTKLVGNDDTANPVTTGFAAAVVNAGDKEGAEVSDFGAKISSAEYNDGSDTWTVAGNIKGMGTKADSADTSYYLKLTPTAENTAEAALTAAGVTLTPCWIALSNMISTKPFFGAAITMNDVENLSVGGNAEEASIEITPTEGVDNTLIKGAKIIWKMTWSHDSGLSDADLASAVPAKFVEASGTEISGWVNKTGGSYETTATTIISNWDSSNDDTVDSTISIEPVAAGAAALTAEVIPIEYEDDENTGIGGDWAKPTVTGDGDIAVAENLLKSISSVTADSTLYVGGMDGTATVEFVGPTAQQLQYAGNKTSGNQILVKWATANDAKVGLVAETDSERKAPDGGIYSLAKLKSASGNVWEASVGLKAKGIDSSTKISVASIKI